MKSGSKSAAAPANSHWKWLAAAAVVFVLLLQLYGPALHGPFVFDDDYLRFRDPGFLDAGVTSISPTTRPLMNLSFWLNLRFFGMEDTYSYHFTNVVLHFLNGVLVFFALRKLLELVGEKAQASWMPAAIAALLFLLHPLQTESVAYVAGRSESLSLFWFLGAYTLFLYKRASGIGWGAAVGVILLFGAAFSSKEHTAVLPALLVLTDWLFPEGKPFDTVKRNWRLYLPMLVMAGLGAALVLQVLTTADTAGFGMKDLPWHNYFFTQWRVLWVYARLFLLPVGLNADWEFPISRSPMDYGAIFGLLALLAVTGAAFWYRKRFPLAFYGLLVFFLLIAPTSSIMPIRDPLAERRMYLPFIGLLAILCDLLRRVKFSKTVLWGGVSAILVAFAVLTHSRAAVWGDPVALWQDTVAKSPGNSRARFQLAMSYYERRRCDEAIKEFEVTERLSATKEYSLYVDWGLAYDCLEKHELALGKFRQAVALKPSGHTRALIGMALAKLNQPGAALDELNEAAKLEPGYDMLYVYRGNVYLQLNEFAKAEADYRKALSITPENAGAQQGLTVLARRRGSTR